MAKRNPERRMSLGGHLRELRNRLYWSALFVAIAAIGGWFLFEPVFEILQKPFFDLAASEGIGARIVFGTVSAPFDLRMQVSLFLGVIIASPFWLYNLWAYVAPALNLRTRRIAVTFVSVSTPLFLSGCYLAWTLIPTFVKSLLSFTPVGSDANINANDYILFTLRILVVFGLALVLPAVLLLLNYLGVMSANSILKGWRLAVFFSAVVAALATPVSDPMSMLLLAVPLIALYFLAALIAKIFDRKKEKAKRSEATADDQ
jgi:sec-independent protein translocase protein TatC